MDIKETLRRLTECAGVSGEEQPAADIVLPLLREYAPDAEADAFGNVTGVIKTEGAERTLLLDAHLDCIGMIVTHIEDDGFLRVGACGGLDMRTLLAQSVTVYGKTPLRGVVCTLPPHVSADSEKVPEIGDIAVDIGLSGEQARQQVSLGDRVAVSSEFRQLCGERVSAPAIDNRAGVCAVLAALDMLNGRKLKYDLAVCFSAQEETGERGARTAAYRLAPDEAIVVDVSFGRTPDSSPHETAELGSGVMIGVSAALDRGMTQQLKSMAERLDIPYTMEVMPSSTGTNADAVTVTRGGVCACTLSVPIRYMHTSVETADLRDIEAAARLICEYAAGGDGNV